MPSPISLQNRHTSENSPIWETDPLGEYRWINIEGPLSRLADALWIFGEGGRKVSTQILVPHWKLCLAVVRRWNVATSELEDVNLSVLGPVKNPRRNEGQSGLEIVAVRLHPEAAGDILDIKPIDIVDHDPMFEQWRGLGRVRQLAENGAPANDVGQALLGYLQSRLTDATGHIGQPAAGARIIRQSLGLRRIKTVADELNIPERTFRRRFELDIGLSPKQYARRVRLMSLLLQTDQMAKPNWSGVAHDFGYFDQAHMIEDMRDLAGIGLSSLHKMRRGII